MTSPFTLAPTGPEVSCDFPGCILDAFHEGEHEFAKAKPELSLRFYTCSICQRKFRVYGYHIAVQVRTCGDQECILALAMRDVTPPPIMCVCSQRQYPHELSIHSQLRSESYNPEKRFLWPWSLVLSERAEPSTERKAA